ncbi:hypothetical protein [Vibrio phage vB_VibM_10AMN]|uniref:Carrier domain-containing protein n=1 Tax=Staphylococcus phage vB_VibM_10AMN12 TaxID=3076785 RepID=A0AA96KSF1_9CAUD|nr:hypothetical protein [Vibrio phage vB_VibM_10AMN]WNO47422.1 hypothetical protein [Staphylococcus phage vB_VibM_10AMN12]
MEAKEVCDKIDNLLVKWLGTQISKIKTEADLRDDLCCDSLDLVEFLLAVEEAFDVDISNEEAEKCKTVGDVYKGILSKLGIIPLSGLGFVLDTGCKPEITKTPSETTKEALMEVKNCTSTSSDIFQQMLTLAKQNNMFIQFDGFAQDENDAIVVTKQGGDTEYVIETQEQFNQLVESFKLLEKFERS